MKFYLYCEGDPVSLGIEDAEGDWDMTAFKKHLESCCLCGQLVELITRETIDSIEQLYRKEKGSRTAALSTNNLKRKEGPTTNPSLDTEVLSNEQLTILP